MQLDVITSAPHVDLLDLLLATLDHLEEGDERAALVVVEVEGERVRHPAMNTTTTGVHPEEVLESERFCEG